MGHERGCSALVPGWTTCGSHHYQPMDRTIMPSMEGNSGYILERRGNGSGMLQMCIHSTKVSWKFALKLIGRHTNSDYLCQHEKFWGYGFILIFTNQDHIIEILLYQQKNVSLFTFLPCGGTLAPLWVSPSVVLFYTAPVFFNGFLSLYSIIVFDSGKLKVTSIYIKQGKVSTREPRGGREIEMKTVSKRLTEMHSPLTQTVITVNVTSAWHFCHLTSLFISFPARDLSVRVTSWQN